MVSVGLSATLEGMATSKADLLHRLCISKESMTSFCDVRCKRCA